MKNIVPLFQLQRTLKREGKIKLGHKVEGTRQDGSTFTRPASLETFRFTSTNRSVLEEIASMYGGEVTPWADEPGSFQVTTTSQEIIVNLIPGVSAPRFAYEYWSGGGCQRRCDGTVCQHAVGDVITEKDCLCKDRDFLTSLLPAKVKNLTGDALEAELEKLQCKCRTRVSVQMAGTTSLGVWLIESNGFFAATEFAPMVETLLQLGQQVMVKLALEPREIGNGKAKKNFVVPVVRIAKNAHEELRARGGISLTDVLPRPQLAGHERPALPVVDVETGEVLSHSHPQEPEVPAPAPAPAPRVDPDHPAVAAMREHGLDKVEDASQVADLKRTCAAKGLDWKGVLVEAVGKGHKKWMLINAYAQAIEVPSGGDE